MSQYPRDEFDEVSETAARQGVHRERLVPSVSSGLGLKILVGVLALAMGLAAYFILPRLGIGEGAEPSGQLTGSTAAGSASPEPEASPEPSRSASSGPAGAAGTREPLETTPSGPTESPTPVPTETPQSGLIEENPAAVDKLQPVNVLNGTAVGGLANSAAGRLMADGWSVGEVGNWAGQPLQGSIIFYSEDAQLASAEEIGRVLGIPTLLPTSEVSPNITVVVGPGFQ